MKIFKGVLTWLAAVSTVLICLFVGALVMQGISLYIPMVLWLSTGLLLFTLEHASTIVLFGALLRYGAKPYLVYQEVCWIILFSALPIVGIVMLILGHPELILAWLVNQVLNVALAVKIKFSSMKGASINVCE